MQPQPSLQIPLQPLSTFLHTTLDTLQAELATFQSPPKPKTPPPAKQTPNQNKHPSPEMQPNQSTTSSTTEATHPPCGHYCGMCVLCLALHQGFAVACHVVDRQADVLDVAWATRPRQRGLNCFTKSYARYVKGTGSVLAADMQVSVEE